MKKILFSVIPLVAFSATQVAAQTRTVSGRLTDRSTGEGLPGVTVLLKGTNNGVSTNSDGSYTLNVPATGGTLVFSSIGFVTVEQAIGASDQLSTSLAADSKQLSEVVVTGYGIRQEIKDLTGSVAQVQEKALLTQPVQSFEQSLAGRMTGVQVTNTGGALGDGTSVRIRGANSISGSSQPLYVIDGVPVNTRENANVFNGGNGTRYNPLADINPNDIESVQVLKDASASAIYGSRAANGVILINTKRGKNGQNLLSINSFVGYYEATRLPKLLNGDDFTTIQNEKGTNSGRTTPLVADIDLDKDGKADRTDWLKEVFRSGFSQNYQAALSGGNDKASYYGSADYSDQKGIIDRNRLRRASARLNLDVTPKTWLKGGISLGYSQSRNQGVLTERYLAGATVSGYSAPPNVPVYNPDGSYYLNPLGNLGDGNNAGTGYVFAFSNPRAILDLQRNDNTSRRLLGNGYLTVTPVKGLSLTTKYGIDYLDNFEDQYSDIRLSGLGRAYEGLIQNNRLDRYQYNWQNYANYNTLLGGKHEVGLTGGIEYQNLSERQLYVGASKLADTKFNTILDGLSSGDPFNGGTAFGSGFRSFYGNASYSFDNRYYATFSVRADADSRFGKDNQTGYFPGGSIGWRISEESFMEGLKPVLGDLKLRASYGKVGNSNGIGVYASRTLAGGARYVDLNGFGITQLGNDALKWESSKKLDIGLDATVFTDRITATLDYFNNDIDGLLLDAPTPLTLGVPGVPFGSVARNIGRMVNQGFEASLNTINVNTASGFRWTSNFNFTTLKNEVKELVTTADISSGSNRASIDKRLGVYQLIRWAGVNPANGNSQFLDKDGNVKQYDAVASKWYTANGDVTTGVTQADAVYSEKSGYPTYYGGFDNTFSWKGIELGVFMQYSGGNLVYNGTRAGLLTNSVSNNLEEIKDRWTTPGQNTDIPKLVFRDAVSTQASTRWLEKGDFLRFRQINLGYNLPSTMTQRYGFSRARIYAQVQNAFVITKYTVGDPEVNFNRNNALSSIAYGVDNRSVPQTRAYTLGLNLSF
ncbi:SusC/RagA family TonB-linked outer membrane protein [Hymenobacter rubripertinctus]|uniref:TonB-dependent receptor n=1 Tax=Hymenobacter rubripertinctus TaxID=2029981 RepID=A0A418QV57_9BACT|nr:TonB-dependent receptor [Hymenobacter rubripertinctus]RIY09112.1 TonB-dependent receptor [Hymenobacter rubripertinctus]